MEGGVVVKGRVTIDTRPPFRSVKDAVTLFGEKVLAGGVYAPKLKEDKKTRVESGRPGNNEQTKPQPTENRGSAMKTELEETKQRLEKAREEGEIMKTKLNSLKQELEQARRELNHLKSKKNSDFFRYEDDHHQNPEIEEIKCVERSDSLATVHETQRRGDFEFEFEFGRVGAPAGKKVVSFASPPSLVREIRGGGGGGEEKGKLERAPSLRKEGRKKVMGWLLMARKKRDA